MSMNIKSATKKLATFLQSNLADPINDRTTAWIYDDGVRIDLDKSSFPKILVKNVDEPSNKEQAAIGCTATENTDIIFVEIKTLMGEKYHDNIDDVDYNATEFAALIGSRAEDLIKLNHDYFVTEGFLDVLAVQDKITEDKDRNPTFELGIQMHYISDPN